VSAKEEAAKLIDSLPQNATWGEILYAVQRGSAGGRNRPAAVRELQAPYGSEYATYAREEEAMHRDFDVVIERDTEGLYVASVPALRGCHTQAGTLDVLMERVREAIELCVEVAGAASTEFVGIRRVSVPA
jgi:predicted RNase H-like HicB family nuclease